MDWTIVGCYLFGCALVVSFDLLASANIDSLAEIDPDSAARLATRAAYLGWPWALVSGGIVLATAVALRLRRSRPLGGVILLSAFTFLEQGLLTLPNSVALFFLLFAVPVHRGVRAGWLAFGIAAAANIVMTQLTGGMGGGVITPSGVAIASGPFGFGDVGLGERMTVGLVGTLWLLVVLMVGINIGNRRRYVFALIDRVRQLALEREQRAQLAAAAERARIAREMHDVVAHSLSVVVTLSEAASVTVETRPDAAKHAMQRAAETGRDALVEMRRLLGVLADEEAGVAVGHGQDRAPQPGVAQLPELVQGFVEAGLHISFSEAGVPAGDAAQQLAVYRIAQEGLTNSLRHAGPGSRVDLAVAHSPSASTVEVVDSGPMDPGRITGSGGGARIPGSGRGLSGARQRARIFGGDVEHGPRGAGYRLFATVPVPETAGRDRTGAESEDAE